MGRPAELSFGTGIYSFPAAAKLLSRHHPGGLKAARLRYWMDTGLTPASLGKAPSGSDLLSFHDLVSLELVRRFRGTGVSLQRVRKLESELKRRYPKIVRPMAYDVFYTDGSAIWHQFNPDDDAVVEEIVGRRARHYAWTPAIRTFAEEIRYEPEEVPLTEETRMPRMAAAWNLSQWVEINPAIQFGTPIVRGTRIPISAIIADLGVGSPEDVAEWHGLQVEQVEDVRDYFVAAA
jgi:uncharacterized protein (DUF433 family)/DNA-binding transcriptional MerR regulator